jgi:hypothetical protein
MPAYLTPQRLTAIVAFVAIAVAIPIEIAGGVPGFPTIPPGMLIALGAAILIGAIRWRWTPVVGILVTVFLLVGFVASRGYVRLLGAESGLATVGVWLQLVATLVALVASGAALMRQSGSGKPARTAKTTS